MKLDTVHRVETRSLTIRVASAWNDGSDIGRPIRGSEENTGFSQKRMKKECPKHTKKKTRCTAKTGRLSDRMRQSMSTDSPPLPNKANYAAFSCFFFHGRRDPRP